MIRVNRGMAVFFLACAALAVSAPQAQAQGTPQPAGSVRPAQPAPPGAQSQLRTAVPVALPTQPVPVVGNRISTRYGFVSHAAYISVSYHLDTLSDPQVFVQDPRVPAGAGLQNIHHAASFRNALLSDDPASSLANANGDPLGHNLATWLAARGALSISPVPGGERVTATFQNLIPGGHYSLFENIYPATGMPAAIPLDEKGTANNFIADNDGHGTLTVNIRTLLTHANAVALIYHSDAQFHGTVRGEMGITAHVQLIQRIP